MTEVVVQAGKVLVALAASGLASSGLVRADDQPVEVQLVDAMNKLWGTHAGFRANHAKGIVVEGPRLAGRIGARQPARHCDQIPSARGSDTDMVIYSLKFFPVSTGADFRDSLLASAASPPNAAKPTKFDVSRH